MNASGDVLLGALALLIVGSLATPASSVVTTVNSNSPSCLVEIPDSVSISSWSNSTMQGSSVTFANGTEMVFPDDTCVRPVSPSVYALDLGVESNANFTRAENGSSFAPPNAYETCSQFAAQPSGPGGTPLGHTFCPPQPGSWASAQPPFNCPGGASDVPSNTNCAPYVMLTFNLYGKTEYAPCPNEHVADDLEALIAYVPDSNGTFDTSSVFVQVNPTPVVYMCGAVTTLSSTTQTSESVEGSSSSNTPATSSRSAQASLSNSSAVGQGGQSVARNSDVDTTIETIGIIAGVAVVMIVAITTRTRRGSS